PAQSHLMTLLPCFHSHQFHCEKKNDEIVLHLKVFSRSSDVLFGLPFNYTQYALYLQMMAQALGYTAGTLLVSLTDAHVYTNQFEYA
ncbi:MAG: thymidylate synthase, partial [Candidatus Korarchaeota archaeon]|nr:thymidylate synthase [Candidatus Korarchaeota archaeon]